jgi:hypothetical protein
MSQINQVILDKAGLSDIIVKHFAEKFPEGLIIDAQVFFFGTPPKHRASQVTTTAKRTSVYDRYIKDRGQAQDNMPPLLQDVGAIVVLDPKPKPG